MNRNMILISGIFLIVFSLFKSKVPHVIWDSKLIKACWVILGLYNIVLAIFFKQDLSMVLFVVDFILYALLDMGLFIIVLIKGKKGMIKNVQLGISILCFLSAVFITCYDINEIYSSILILYILVIIISTPLQEARALYKNGK